MQFICDDSRGTEWVFSGGRYIRRSKDSHAVLCALKGEYLPNPETLWKNRCMAANKPNGTAEVRCAVRGVASERLKPSPVTFALYQHWREYNANRDT